MNDRRQVWMGLFMALLFTAILFGSLSLSLMESGYALAQAATPGISPTFPLFTGEPLLTLVNLQTGVPTYAVTFTPIFSPTPTVTVTPPPNCPPPPGWMPIIVQPDDTLGSLARAYSMSVQSLAGANCLAADSRLIPGTVLYVPLLPTATQPCRPPVSWVPYVVQYGDTLYSLAYRVGMTAWQLQSSNCLPSAYIYTGQLLYLPYYPPVYYTPYYTATRPPTLTPRPPTFTPTYWPSATFTWYPTWTNTVRPSSTFTQQATDTPATGTPPTPPTDTPLPPPTDTPLPPTDTLPPPPTETPLPPPTDTPLPPPTNTPLPPPTDTPHPPPTPTNYIYPYP